MNPITNDRTMSTKGASMSTPSTINRRGFLKIAGILALIAAMHTPFAFGQDAIGKDPGAQPKPNILLIYADDLGWGDVGYQSEGRFLTPNIDRLAQEGVVFSNSYSCGANCAPSRASLLSGGYTPRHRLMGNGTDRGPKNHQRLVPIPTERGLAESFVTVAEALKGSGYATAHFGKWHIGSPHHRGRWSLDQGFDVSFDVGKDKKGSESDPSLVYTLTDKAVEFMASNRNRPFFVYLAHYAIHTSARNCKPESRQLVAERAKAANVNDTYMANTYDFDDSVGKLLTKLREIGLEDNTLVVFASDNGASRDQSLDPVPLSGRKGAFYEGGGFVFH
jgi:arylsulfatase A-like enzyme